MSIEVLVVDDELRAARTCADYLKIHTSLTVAHTDDAERALEIIRTDPVKVVVLDQRMQEGARTRTTGTRLFEQIRQLDHRVRCVIFSALSQEKDLEHMLDLHVSYLKKSQLEQLPALVSAAKMEYLTDLARDHARRPVALGSYRERFSRLHPPSVTFELIGVEDVSSTPQAREADYKTARRLDRPGKYTFVETDEAEIVIEDEHSHEVGIHLSIKAAVYAELTASVDNVLRDQHHETMRRHVSDSTKSELELSADQAVAQTYQRARLYLRRRAIVRLSCECCGRPEIVILEFHEWTGRYQHRRLDALADGTKKWVDLGES